MHCTVTNPQGETALFYPSKVAFISDFCDYISDSMRRYQESRKYPIFYYGRFQINAEIWMFTVSISEKINVLQCIRHAGNSVQCMCDGRPTFSLREFREFLYREILKGANTHV